LHPEHGTEGARRRVSFMTNAFPDAMVSGWERLEPDMTTDPKDRHVLAAAVWRSSGRSMVVRTVPSWRRRFAATP